MKESVQMDNKDGKLTANLEEKIRKIFGITNGITQELDEADNVISLVDEDGEETEFEFIALIEVRGDEFVVLLPIDASEDVGEVVILKIETSEEDFEEYVSVDDDATVQEVFNIFKEKFADKFDFVD